MKKRIIALAATVLLILPFTASAYAFNLPECIFDGGSVICSQTVVNSVYGDSCANRKSDAAATADENTDCGNSNALENNTSREDTAGGDNGAVCNSGADGSGLGCKFNVNSKSFRDRLSHFISWFMRKFSDWRACQSTGPQDDNTSEPSDTREPADIAVTETPASTQNSSPAETTTATKPTTTKPAATKPSTTKPATTKPATTEPPATEPPATTPSGSADNLSFEEKVAELVNAERAKYGLEPLTLSAELSDIARIKSQDMHDNNYFSHTSPSFGSTFNLLNSHGISYRAAGENIAKGFTTPEAVMNGWMNSSGHRANILSPSFTQIGVGYVADGRYWTQVFIG